MNKNKNYFLPALFYDSDCAMCIRFKDSLIRLPGGDKICMLSIRESDIFASFPEIDPLEAVETIHLMNEERRIFKGPEVIQYLLEYYPGVSKFAWLLDNQVGKKALELFYKSINQYRKSTLGNCKSCHKKV